jgi:hypothetical protein
MSDQISNATHALVVGVVKFDWNVAGFPQVKAIAEEWAKDPGFAQIIVRHVSSENWGIQFIYTLDKEHPEVKDPLDYFDSTYHRPLAIRPYASDITASPIGVERIVMVK